MGLDVHADFFYGIYGENTIEDITEILKLSYENRENEAFDKFISENDLNYGFYGYDSIGLWIGYKNSLHCSGFAPEKIEIKNFKTDVPEKITEKLTELSKKLEWSKPDWYLSASLD